MSDPAEEESRRIAALETLKQWAVEHERAETARLLAGGVTPAQQAAAVRMARVRALVAESDAAAATAKRILTAPYPGGPPSPPPPPRTSPRGQGWGGWR